jgi:predicted transcriptional regulator of viral defense system
VPRPSSSGFFGATPVFTRAEFANACRHQPSDRAVTELLKYHLRVGNIRRIARGVFASIPKGIVSKTATVDRLLAASRLRAGAVIAYRSALELHGSATACTSEVQVIASGEPGLVQTSDFACRFISPPSQHSPTEGVTTVERQGLAVNVTTLERTLVDLFDRYDLAGGADNLFQSLDLVVERQTCLDVDALIKYAQQRGNAAAAGTLGYWLEQERHPLGITNAARQAFQALAPRHARYALGAAPGHGRAATGWNVILPTTIVERYLDD